VWPLAISWDLDGGDDVGGYVGLMAVSVRDIE
jgi:hypothetical protein